MKFTCVIDTCSCLVLNNAEFGQHSLLTYFDGYSNLKYSKEVGIELRDHRSKGLPAVLYERDKKLLPRKFTMDEYEKRMIGKILVSRDHKNDKGEIDNFIVSVDQIHHHFKLNSVVFITDDKKALKTTLVDWLASFPTLKVWTSYDVVLYLYAENIIPSKDIANDMIQSIIAFTAPAIGARSQKTADELLAVKKSYADRIEKISTLLK